MKSYGPEMVEKSTVNQFLQIKYNTKHLSNYVLSSMKFEIYAISTSKKNLLHNAKKNFLIFPCGAKRIRVIIMCPTRPQRHGLINH